MDKRVYGVIGISSIMANWNADFSGYPKSISSGEVFGSDKALKYPMKKVWQEQGENVLYIKSLRLNEEKGEISIIPRTLKERYEMLYPNNDLAKTKDMSELVKNLFNCIDVKNFGATFAEGGMNIGITGAVQIGQGFNKYKETTAEDQDILSPFRDSTAKDKSKNDEEAKSSTLGTKIVSNEAHYFYPFSINPQSYDSFKEMGLTNGYDEQDYAKFKKAALSSATLFATNSKIGCENEFAIFVETDLDAYLPNLSEYINFEKTEEKNKIEITCSDLLNELSSKIKQISIYYNPYTTDLVHNIENAKIYNILTDKEV